MHLLIILILVSNCLALSSGTMNYLIDYAFTIKVMNRCHIYDKPYYDHPVYKKVKIGIPIAHKTFKISIYEIRQFCKEARELSK